MYHSTKFPDFLNDNASEQPERVSSSSFNTACGYHKHSNVKWNKNILLTTGIQVMVSLVNMPLRYQVS